MQYIFIFGASRTGTSLVMRMIDKSEVVQIYNQETHAFPWLWKGNTINLPKEVNTPQLFANYILEKYPTVNFSWKAEHNFVKLKELAQQIQTEQFLPKSAIEFMTFLISKNISKEIKYIGEKTPAHGYYYKPILNYFKNSKVIFTIRDPRATAYSEIVKRNIQHLNLDSFNTLQFIVKYNTIYQQINKVQKKIGKNNVLVVKYEDIVLQSEKTIKAICTFLNIEFKEDMLTVGVFNSSFGDKYQTEKDFNTENIDRWKDNLSNNIVFLIEKHCKQLMKKYNYSFTNIKSNNNFTLLQQTKIKVAYWFNGINAAWFHHFNRNKKYK